MRRREWIAGALALAGCKPAVNLPELGSVPPFEFINESGQPYGSAQLKSKVWVADFFFTNCPGPCPRMSNQLKRVQQETSGLDNVRLVSITVDPDRDTAATLLPYSKKFGARPERWAFLTGRKDLIRNLMSESFYLGFADSMQEHSTRFVLVDQAMKIRGFYDSFAKDGIDNLIEDLKLLHDRT